MPTGNEGAVLKPPEQPSDHLRRWLPLPSITVVGLGLTVGSTSAPARGLAHWLPGLHTGDLTRLELLHDAHGWENEHGAQEVRVYRVRPA